MERLAPELREDRALLADVAVVAAAVLHRHGDDLEGAERTDGWVNPGWMSDRFVIRVGLVPGRANLRREAQVAAALPAAVGYPEVVDTGVVADYEYLLTRRIPGTSVSRVWPTLSWNQRARALDEMWALAEQVHALDLHGLGHLDLTASPFYPASVADAVASVTSLQAAGLLSGYQTDRLVAQLQEFIEAVSSTPSVLNHGDLYMGNAMWDGNRVGGLLDFEFAVIAPVELDLNEFVKHAVGPADTIGDDGSPGFGHLRQVVMDVVAKQPILPAVLKGYSILLESWLTHQAVARRPTEEIRGQPSYRLLAALAEWDGGYLASLLSL